jgi:hypothetical protein
MARSSLPVAGPKRLGSKPIIPLAGALARMPFAPISPGLAQPSPALRQSLPAPPPMSMAPMLSRPRVVATPMPVKPQKMKPPRLTPIKPKAPGGRRGLA